MDERPSIVLHPGFPKCATSSIQQSFVAKDHALARELGVQFLGRNFLPNNGHPDVIRLMDNPAGCLTDLAAADYPAGRYFLSNEALCGNVEFVSALFSRFRVEKAVFTVRLPTLQAISAYRFSGWVKRSFDQAFRHPTTDFMRAQSRFQRKLTYFTDLGVPTLLCPLEGSREGILTRFCGIAFGTAPATLAKEPDRRANQSIGLAFANALHSELRDTGGLPAANDFRRRLIKAARAYRLGPSLNRLSCPEIALLESEARASVCAEYRDLLVTYGLPDAEADEAGREAASSLENLLGSSVASEDQMTALRQHARAVIEQAR